MAAPISQFKNVVVDSVINGTPAGTPGDGTVPSLGDGTVVKKATADSYFIQLDIASVSSTGVQVNVSVYKSSTNRRSYIVKGAPVPIGSALSVIDNQKIVLETDDELIVECATPGEFVDVTGSLVEDVNS